MIETSRLLKSYRIGRQDYPALRGLSFSVADGEFVSIMGPSGCGKSTLLNILGLLDRPSGGSYRLAGHESVSLDDSRRTELRRRQIGFVFQSFNLLPRLSALDNVCLPMSYAGVPTARRRERARVLLGRVGLAGKAEKTPLELSGGERQRVGIARALSNEPGLILADEPTGNLDSKTSVEVLDLFSELHGEGRTIVLVTHDKAVADRAQRVLHIKDGLIEREVKNR